uniref:MutL_C domain-containing protein n=1 Tax=Strongyloides papillosus TaxID=174720 RepID=A0A0N5CBI4_STREA
MLSQVNDKTNRPSTLSIDDDDMDEIDENLEPNINNTTDVVEETTDFAEKTADSNHGKSTSPGESPDMNDRTTVLPEKITIANGEATDLIPETDISSSTSPDEIFKKPKEIPSEEVDLSNRPQVTLKFSLKALKERIEVLSLQEQVPPVKKEEIHVIFGEEIGKEAEETLKRRINKSDFARMHIIGQFNNGFIICKLENDVFIVDQHASDEICNFERLQRNKRISPHRLLKPIQIKLGAVYETAIRDWCYTGGDNECTELTHIPHLDGYKFEVSDVEEMAVYLAENPGSNYRPENIRKVFASKACRGSVMVGDPLMVNKMKSILENLSKLHAPWNCPHGRPTVRQLYYEK